MGENVEIGYCGRPSRTIASKSNRADARWLALFARLETVTVAAFSAQQDASNPV